MTRKKSVKEDLKVYSNELNTVIHVKALKEKEFLTLFNRLIKYVKAVKSGEFDYISYIMPIIDNALPASERKEFDTRLLKYNDKSNPDANKIGKYRVYRAYYFAITNIYPLLGVEYVCSNLNESVADKFDINDILSEIEDDEDDEIFMEKPKPKPKKKATAKKNKDASHSLVTASDIKEIEKFLKKNVIGQDEAIQTVTTALKLKAVGFADHVNLFFIGRTGRGKSLLSKKLGEKYSGNTWIINCGELQNGHEINKFLGAPPGYIGSTEKSILREKAEISNKWVIIFDEIEKAHPKFYNFVLALTDTGTATDSMGYEADFTDSIFIFTSNCGISDLKNSTINWKATRSQNSDKEDILKSLETQFSPEFRGRIDEFVFFNDLNKEDIKMIVKDLLHKLPIVVTDELVEFVIAKGYSEEYGVRDVNRVVKNLVKHPLAEAILDNRLPKSTGLNFDLAINDGKVQVVNTIGLSK